MCRENEKYLMRQNPSNYRYDLAPYTWQLVQEMKGKKAIFTQPGMPIKCAGVPQKAMYLSCDEWLVRTGS